MQGPWWSLSQSLRLFYLLAVLFGTAGCVVQGSTVVRGEVYIPTLMMPEEAYCGESSKIIYSGTRVTIQGDAFYQRREPFFDVGPYHESGLGDPGPSRPIRYAEVHVVNSAGVKVQCTETDSMGHFTFEVPQGSETYTVLVISRGANASVYAYVYNDPRENRYYSLTRSFTPDGHKTLPNLLAEAIEPHVLGGAFNILDQIVEANDELRAQVGNCSLTFAGCVDFTVAPRVTAYWKLGFNPVEYQGASYGGSYYLPGYSRLFILGGREGDINNSDTDHFDNSVILHEYGHFLEDIYFTSDSPGGSHNGNHVIDPRLAWSEGWGNFIQAVVRHEATYIDTEGNSSGSTQMLFYVDLENQTPNHDTPQSSGEGNFREFSITRFLWDTVDNGVDTVNGAIDNVSHTFDEIWYSLNNANGWKKSSAAFRQIGLLHAFQSTFGTNWGDLQTMERQLASVADYGQYVTTTGTCTYSMSPGALAANGSDLLYNNDFLYLRLTSAQTVTITLNYQDQNGVGPEANLDLYLYNESARLGNSADIVASSVHTPDTNAATAESESISKSLSAGKYLLNVKANVSTGAIGGPVDYYLTLNGSRLCPAALP